jgi:endonuclease YncB( thermonuclease family)
MVNLVILREGHARALTGRRASLKYEATLLACHREAREARRGLWSQR